MSARRPLPADALRLETSQDPRLCEIYGYVCMYVLMYIYREREMYVCIMYIHIYIHTHIHTYIWQIYIYIYICMYVYVCYYMLLQYVIWLYDIVSCYVIVWYWLGSQGMGVVSNNRVDRDLLSIFYMSKPWRWPMFKPTSLGPPWFPLKQPSAWVLAPRYGGPSERQHDAGTLWVQYSSLGGDRMMHVEALAVAELHL